MRVTKNHFIFWRIEYLKQFSYGDANKIDIRIYHYNFLDTLIYSHLRRFLLPLLAVFIMNLKHRVILRKHILYILSSVVNLTPNLREPHLAFRQ